MKKGSQARHYQWEPSLADVYRFQELGSSDEEDTLMDPLTKRRLYPEGLYYHGDDSELDLYLQEPPLMEPHDVGYDDEISEDDGFDFDPEAELLVARAMNRIKTARKRGLSNVSLPTDELEALGRRHSTPSVASHPPSRPPSKDQHRRTSSPQDSSLTRPKKRSRGFSLFSSSPKSRRKSVSSKKSVGAAAPDDLATYAVAGGIMTYNPRTGERIYTPAGYEHSQDTRASRSGSQSTSRPPLSLWQYVDDDPRQLRSRARASSNDSAYSSRGGGEGDPFTYQTAGGWGTDGASTPPYIGLGRRVASAPNPGEVSYSPLRRVPVPAHGNLMRGLERRSSGGSSNSEGYVLRVPSVPEDPAEGTGGPKVLRSKRRRRR